MMSAARGGADVRLRKLAFGSAACASLTWALLASGAGAQPTMNGHPDFSGLWQCRTNCGNGVTLPRDKMGHDRWPVCFHPGCAFARVAEVTQRMRNKRGPFRDCLAGS